MRTTKLAKMALMLSAGLTTGCGYEIFFPPLEVAERVDISRYVGKWYEIARYPNSFEQGCQGVTAEYTLREDGTVKVLNTCRQGAVDGPESQIEGFATVADPTTNAKLTVYFFFPFGAPYWILELDPDYQYAVVGDPSRSTLWILSRTPTMDEALYQSILERLPGKGFVPTRLERTPQTAS